MSDTALKPETRDIVVEEMFPHSPETIWKVLTTGELIGRWLRMPLEGFSPTPGTRFTFQTKAAGAWDGVIRCQVLDVVQNQTISYSWRGGDEANVGYGSRLDTVVTWTIFPDAHGTRLRLVHSGFATPRNDSALQTMSNGWKTVVQTIGEIAGAP